MKKLMIAAAIVCAAAVSQAATYNWADSKSGLYSWTGEASDWAYIAEGTTAYIFFADAYSQTTLVNDFAKGGINMTKVLADSTSTVNIDGGISQSKNFVADYTSAKSVYYAIVEDGHLFVSDVATAGYDALTPVGISFTDQTDFSDVDYTPIRDASAGYDGAGWYAVAPEPTSGLLLLLGVAGLALKRKRA